MASPPRPVPSAPNRRRVSTLLHRLREEIRREWQVELHSLEGVLGAELRQYRGRYEEDFGGVWRVEDTEGLLEAVRRADIVYSGDHHTLPAAQRLPIRLLRRMEPDGRPVTIALEMLHSSDQGRVDAYLAGRLSATALREAISFDTRWGFDWLAYLPLLEYARRHGFPVLAVNSDAGPARGRLARRDRHAARCLIQRLLRHPGERLLVLAGDWHVARQHLPERVSWLATRHGLALRRVVIHQNHDGLYRRFIRRAPAPPAVARRGQDLFCVFNATPLTKVSARLGWGGGRALHSMHGDGWTTDGAAAFHDVMAALARHLQLAPPPEHLTIWQIDDEEDARVALEMNGLLGPAWRRRLAAGEPVYRAATGDLLLPAASLNRLADEAARQLGARWAGWRPRSSRASFFGRAVQAGATFFASRLLNPNRKCELLADLIATAPEESRRGFEAAWARRLLGAGSQATLPVGHAFWRAHPTTRRRVAETVGSVWGYHLYDAYEGGLVDLPYLQSLFETPRGVKNADDLFQHGWAAWRYSIRARSKRELL